MDVTVVTRVSTAQKVIYSLYWNKKKEILLLGLFFVYLFNSECDDKHFGPNCIEMCNSTCKSCNKSTGICDNGCHPGWRGVFCEEGMFINMQTLIIMVFFIYFVFHFIRRFFICRMKTSIVIICLPFSIISHLFSDIFICNNLT